MKILEFEQGLQKAYNERPWMFAITKDDYVVYRSDYKIYGIAVSDKEYDFIINTRKYIEDFCHSATEECWRIITEEWKNYIRYNPTSGLDRFIYIHHGYYKSSKRASHYYRLKERIDGIKGIYSWLFNHSYAREHELIQMMSDFSDVFADDAFVPYVK